MPIGAVKRLEGAPTEPRRTLRTAPYLACVSACTLGEFRSPLITDQSLQSKSKEVLSFGVDSLGFRPSDIVGDTRDVAEPGEGGRCSSSPRPTFPLQPPPVPFLLPLPRGSSLAYRRRFRGSPSEAVRHERVKPRADSTIEAIDRFTSPAGIHQILSRTKKWNEIEKTEKTEKTEKKRKIEKRGMER